MIDWGQFLTGHTWHFGAMAVLLAFSGFFSGTETAMFSLSRGQLHQMKLSSGTGRVVAAMMAKPENILNCLLLGNMLVNVAYAATSTLIVYNLKDAGASGLVVAPSILCPLLVLILIGEVGPKTMAYVYRQRWASLAAGPMVIIQRILWPVLRLSQVLLIGPLTQIIAPARQSDLIKAEELAAMLELSAKQGIIDHDASELIQEILELPDLHVNDIMVPRVDMVTFNLDGTKSDLVDLFVKTRLRKIPVYDRNADNIVGVVHFKRLLLEKASSLRELVVKVPFVPEAANLERLLMQLRVKRAQMAIVVDEYGGTAGLVTIEDVLEEIVGDIPDPYESQAGGAVIEKVGPAEYIVQGDLAIHEWSDIFTTDLTSLRISTIGGFVLSQLGKIPSPGDTVTYRNLKFTVLNMRRHRIAKLRLELLEDQQ